MKIVVIDNFLSEKSCDEIIYHSTHKKFQLEGSGQKISNVIITESHPDLIEKHIETANSHFTKKLRLDWCQLVKWDSGTGMPYHYDTGKPDTQLASILYLNSDFEGGSTIFLDGTVVAPVKGRVVFFDGMYHKHAVDIITNGTRYVIAGWYNNEKSDNSFS